MKQTELKGIITPILTPMNADERASTLTSSEHRLTDLSMAVCTEFSHLEQTVKDIS